MKKQLFWMIGAALALTSCSNDEQVAVNPVNEITFRTAVPTRVLSTSIYQDNAALENFTVNAWIAETDDNIVNHIQNEKYEKGSDSYTPVADPHYWSVNDKYIIGQAFAAQNEIITLSTEENGLKYVYNNVNVATMIADQKDFVTAEVFSLKDDAEKSGIALSFKHQFAQIEIVAKNNSEYTIEIAGAKLGDVLTGVNDGNVTLTATATMGEDNKSVSEWKYEWNIDKKDVYTTDYTGVDVEKKDAKEVNVFGTDQVLMVYPQTLTAYSSGDFGSSGAYIAVLAKIDHGNLPIYPVGEDEKYADKDEGKYGWLYVGIPEIREGWKANTHYKYTLNFTDQAVGCKSDGTPIMDKDGLVKFVSATVSTWDEDTDNTLLGTN